MTLQNLTFMLIAIIFVIYFLFGREDDVVGLCGAVILALLCLILGGFLSGCNKNLPMTITKEAMKQIEEAGCEKSFVKMPQEFTLDDENDPRYIYVMAVLCKEKMK